MSLPRLLADQLLQTGRMDSRTRNIDSASAPRYEQRRDFDPLFLEVVGPLRLLPGDVVRIAIDGSDQVAPEIAAPLREFNQFAGHASCVAVHSPDRDRMLRPSTRLLVRTASWSCPRRTKKRCGVIVRSAGWRPRWPSKSPRPPAAAGCARSWPANWRPETLQSSNAGSAAKTTGRRLRFRLGDPGAEQSGALADDRAARARRVGGGRRRPCACRCRCCRRP